MQDNRNVIYQQANIYMYIYTCMQLSFLQKQERLYFIALYFAIVKELFVQSTEEITNYFD